MSDGGPRGRSGCLSKAHVCVVLPHVFCNSSIAVRRRHRKRVYSDKKIEKALYQNKEQVLGATELAWLFCLIGDYAWNKIFGHHLQHPRFDFILVGVPVLERPAGASKEQRDGKDESAQRKGDAA